VYDRLSGEENGGETKDADKAGHDGVAITKTFGDPTVDEESDDFSNVHTL